MSSIKIYSRYLLLIIISSISYKTMAQNQTNELVKQIMVVLDSSYKYYGSDIRKQTMLSTQYDSLFNILTQYQKLNLVINTNELTIQNKIITIAKYKALQPSLFDEVREKYIFGIDDAGKIAPFSPKIINSFVTEQYRLVWEYFLLKPPAAGMSPQYDMRIMEAISRINNSASILVIEKTYINSTKTLSKLDYPLVIKQKNLILTIGKMPSEKAAISLSRLIKVPLQLRDSSKKIEWSPKIFAKDMLAGKQKINTEGNWKILLNRITSSNKIDIETKKILRDIKN